MAVSLPARTALQQSIVDLLRKRGNRLLSIREIHERLRDPEVTRDDIERAIEELEREGIILAVRGKRYSLLEFTPYHAGRIKVHPDGYGTIFGGDQQPDMRAGRDRSCVISLLAADCRRSPISSPADCRSCPPCRS